jgi:predicted Zn finger-like uncharacterized protein
MEIQCPKCERQFRIVDSDDPAEVRCAACGSNFAPYPKTIEWAGQEGDPFSTFVPLGVGPSPGVPEGLGDYDLLEVIARGGMGVVYKARQRSLNRIVALKLIRSGELAHETDVARFRVEAEAAAQLDHPGIVPVYEVGEFEGQQFLSMAYLEGGSLAARMNDGPLPPAEACRHLRSIAEAIQFAHHRGVIHRDLKPQNILLDHQGVPRVTDFGLAKNLNVDSGLTVTGQIMGTPSYMSPEQATGGEMGPLADVYSLGATLYCLLTGRPPFHAATPLKTIRQLVDHDPIPPRGLNPAIPLDLETICLKCLRKEPERRYLSAGALADDLDRWLRREPILARRVGRLEKSWLWCRRRPAVAGVIATAVFAVCLVVGLVIVKKSGASREKDLKNQLAWKQYMEDVLSMDRILSMARSRNYRQAVAEAERMMKSGRSTPLKMYDIGCVFSLACETAKLDNDFPQGKLREFTGDCVRLSLDALEAADRLGYFSIAENRSLLLHDPDLAAVRTDAGFQEFVDRVLR